MLNFLNGIELVLSSFIPGLLYLIILFISTPYKSWDFRKSSIYLIGGTLSIILIFGIQTYLPFWNFLYKIPESLVLQVLVMAFIQVALLEELVKYSLFTLFRKKVIEKNIMSHPLSIMIYSGSVSLGFAFIENILYGFNTGIETVYWRSGTAVILHMICGLMMGYWISMSKYGYKIKTNPTNDMLGVSIFDVVVKNKPKFRKFIYHTFGILLATFFHGLYDFNLMGIHNFSSFAVDDHISWTLQIIILFLGLYIVKNMANHLVELNIKNK
jgi:RsiW-degrading membrane proteinase PrsW (M82 family)